MLSSLELPIGPVAQPWPILVINLDRATDRMHDATRNLKRSGLSFTRFSAVDGEMLTLDLVSELTAPRAGRGFKRPLSRAEVGCFASHLLVWHRIAQGGHARVIVLEDDARLVEGAVAHLAKLADDREDWDILKLCYASPRPPPVVAPAITLPDRTPYGTTGYAITAGAAARLVATTVPFSRPVDIELKTWWEHGLSVKISDPPIGASAEDHEATSSISPGRRQAGEDTMVKRFLSNARYQLDRRMSRMRYVRKMTLLGQITTELHPAMIRLIEEYG
jgi:glycosyl transferase, family 25